MPRSEYMPARDAEFDIFQNNFTDKVAQNLAHGRIPKITISCYATNYKWGKNTNKM